MRALIACLMLGPVGTYRRKNQGLRSAAPSAAPRVAASAASRVPAPGGSSSGTTPDTSKPPPFSTGGGVGIPSGNGQLLTAARQFFGVSSGSQEKRGSGESVVSIQYGPPSGSVHSSPTQSLAGPSPPEVPARSAEPEAKKHKPGPPAAAASSSASAALMAASDAQAREKEVREGIEHAFAEHAFRRQSKDSKDVAFQLRKYQPILAARSRVEAAIAEYWQVRAQEQAVKQAIDVWTPSAWRSLQQMWGRVCAIDGEVDQQLSTVRGLIAWWPDPANPLLEQVGYDDLQRLRRLYLFRPLTLWSARAKHMLMQKQWDAIARGIAGMPDSAARGEIIGLIQAEILVLQDFISSFGNDAAASEQRQLVNIFLYDYNTWLRTLTGSRLVASLSKGVLH